MVNKAILCILDGFGSSENKEYNAIASANTPFLDSLFKSYPNSVLETSGEAVGLPKGQMGNSEVGHMTMGIGRIILQDLPRIDHALNSGEIIKNNIISDLIKNYSNQNKSCHIMGLISDGGVHSHIDHIVYMANLLAENNVNVVIHGFLDGRDTPPRSAIKYIQYLYDKTRLYSNITIASVTGRFFVMDRDKRWDRIKTAYDAIVLAKGEKVESIISAIERNYEKNITDEFIEPLNISGYEGIKEGDAIFMCNFRADRVRQIMSSILEPEFNFFEREYIKLGKAISMMEYSERISQLTDVIFRKNDISNTLSKVVSNHSLSQLRIAETEKYAHVTFFFSGGIEKAENNEDRILIPSPTHIDTYDKCPEMSAFKLTDKLVEEIHKQKYHLIVSNYANADMVGHTGDLAASIKAVEVLDTCLSKLIPAAIKNGYNILITADHGNIEQMVGDDKLPMTSHSLNPVPCIFIPIEKKMMKTKLNNGNLSDIAPTILDIMGLEKPEEMTGKSLITRG